MAAHHLISPAINQIRKWLEPPVFEDAERTRTAALINRILLLSAGLWAGVTTLLIFTGQVATSVNVSFSYLFSLLLFGARELLHRGYLRAATILLPLLFWAGTAVLQYQLGTPDTAHIIGYVLSCAVATLLMGRTAGLIAGLGSMLAIILLEYAGTLGLLPHHADLPPGNQPIIFLSDLTVLYSIIVVIRESLSGALNKAEEELAQRRKAEEELRQLNAHLDEIVSQRTQQLETEIARERQTETALFESDEKFRILMAFTQDWDFWMGPQQDFRYMSASCQRVTGYPPDAFIADAGLMERIVHPDDLDRFQEHTRAALEQNLPCDGFDFRIITAGGDERWIGHVCRPVYGAQGNYLGHCGSNRDITEQKRNELQQKQMEKALRTSEERFRSIFENAPFAYQSLDTDGRFIFTNHNLCALLGYRREELLGRPFNDVWPAEQRGQFGRTFSTFKQRGHVHVDLQLQRKDGQVIFAILEGRVQHDLDGKFVRTHCILIDVTEKQHLQARIERQNALLSGLSHSTLEFLRCRDSEQLLHALLDHATRLLDAPYGKILSLDGEELVLSCFTANQPFLEGDRSGRDDALLAWQAVDSLTPAIIENYSVWPQRRAIYRSVDLRAVAAIPIISGDGQHCLGVIGLGREEPDRPFSPDEIETARLFAQIAGLAIENARLQASLKEQSIRDPLTGLYNRRYLFETLHREVARAAREQVPVSLILLDIDNFKNLNDTNGHGAGDAALCAMAEQFKCTARSSDILCRYGGDEHLIMMYNSPAESALARAEQWRQAIEALPILYGGQILHITISLGVATFPDHGQSIDQVIACADRALYLSKSGGRNRVMLYR